MQFNKLTIITTAILILMILGAGCTDTAGTSPETTTYTPLHTSSPRFARPCSVVRAGLSMF